MDGLEAWNTLYGQTTHQKKTRTCPQLSSSTYSYDPHHRPVSKTESEFFPTGELKQSFGSQAYPVEYTYDPQGRMATMTTEVQAGSAVTRWEYDAQRGWLIAKRYDDHKGPDYTYTPAGRLANRTWACGIETAYTYNNAGDLTNVDYDDSTPDVACTHNRQGQRTEITDGIGERHLTYTAHHLLASETYQSGQLAGHALHHTYDNHLRRTGLEFKQVIFPLQSQTYSYGDASRLAIVTSNQSSAEYSFTSLNQRNRANMADGTCWLYDYNSKGGVISGTRYDASNTPISQQDFRCLFDNISNREEKNPRRKNV